MLPAGEPKFRRRKAERPDEIVAAALAVFSEKGFAAARLDDIAARAGVSKGAIYLYFATKEDIFRAVVEQAILPDLQALHGLAASHPGPFADLVGALLSHVTRVVADSPVGGVLKMVIGEARNFPELAQVWHDRVVGPAIAVIATAIAAAQARGELRPGDPRQHALSLISPLVVGVIWRETFVAAGAAPFDIPSLARQHVATVLGGLLTDAARAAAFPGDTP